MNANKETTMTVQDVLAAVDISVSWTTGDEGETVSRESMPVSEARRAVAALEGAGIEASWAPDHDDRSRAWLYMTEAAPNT